MSTIKKILAAFLAVLMIMPFAFVSASAAPAAPEFKITLVSETDSAVVVRFSLAKGAFSALDFTINTSSAIKDCTKIEKTEEFKAVITDYMVNKGASFSAVESPATKKIAMASTVDFNKPFALYDITFTKKSSAPITSADISVVIDNCGVSITPDANGQSTLDVTDIAKVTEEFKKFTLNETSVSMNYKDSHTVSVDTNYSAEELTWSSSNERVATVDENGNIVATGTGTATITVTSADGQVNETCEVTVSYTVVQWIIIIVLFGWIWY